MATRARQLARESLLFYEICPMPAKGCQPRYNTGQERDRDRDQERLCLLGPKAILTVNKQQSQQGERQQFCPIKRHCQAAAVAAYLITGAFQ